MSASLSYPLFFARLPRHVADRLRLNSPKTNPNLLQRSEVVALINTLHRLAESLHAVDQFRRMWAETDDEGSEQLIREAERASAAAPVNPDSSSLIVRHQLTALALAGAGVTGAGKCVAEEWNGVDGVGGVDTWGSGEISVGAQSIREGARTVIQRVVIIPCSSLKGILASLPALKVIRLHLLRSLW